MFDPKKKSWEEELDDIFTEDEEDLFEDEMDWDAEDFDQPDWEDDDDY